jgi:hypothetical protein
MTAGANERRSPRASLGFAGRMGLGLIVTILLACVATIPWSMGRVETGATTLARYEASNLTLNLLPPNLVGLIHSLEARGLISRRPHPTDGRAMGLHPTPEGSALMQQAEQTATDLEIESSSRLTTAQRKTLLDLLQKIYL